MIRHHVTTQATKKHPQFILAIDSAYYIQEVAAVDDKVVEVFKNPINKFPHELFCEHAQSYLTIREREYLDESLSYHISVDGPVISNSPFITNSKGENKKGDPRYKQLLPYLIARQLQADGTYVYFPYRRTKKVGESRLAGNGSLGYGGHIDLEDIYSVNSVIDLKETILRSTKREAIEEFAAYKGDQILNRDTYDQYISFGDLFIVDNSNDVGELHLGIVMYFDVPAGYRLEATEDELAKLPPMNAEQMRTDPKFNAENWTKIFLLYLKMQELNKIAIDSNLVAIDHGGEKVGQVDKSYLASIAVPEFVKNLVPGELAVITTDLPAVTSVNQENLAKWPNGVLVTGEANIQFFDSAKMPSEVGDAVAELRTDTATPADQEVPAQLGCDYTPVGKSVYIAGNQVLEAIPVDPSALGDGQEFAGQNTFKLHVVEDETPQQAIDRVLNEAVSERWDGNTPSPHPSIVNKYMTHLPKGDDPRDPNYTPVPSQGDSYTNNIDWNNTITGSLANAVDLNLNELAAGQAITNAVNVATESDDKSSY